MVSLTLTLADSSPQEVSEYDAARIYGIRIDSRDSFAHLEIKAEDLILVDASMELVIQTHSYEEPLRYNTTIVHVDFIPPSCYVRPSF